MKLVTNHLLSSTAMVVAFAAAPAFGQSTTPADPNAVAQTSPATPATTTAAPTADDNTIVVTGIRKSLQSARNIKKNSNQIIDAIVAEDIGKLPDIAVSDTAARIPGVQVERGGGEAGRVLVRGLPDYTTTYNGREIFTAETRQVALQDFPSGAIAAIEVFKSSTADLVEPGLGGLVNVRSRRPFDFKGLEVAGSGWVLFPRQSGAKNLNGNLLISDRWNVGSGEMGALISFSETNLHYKDSRRSNAYFVAPGPNGGRYPDWPFIEYNEGRRTRPSINGAIQWRPQPGLEFYLEGLWQGFRNKVEDRHFEVPLWGGANYTNIQFRDGTDLIDSGTVQNPFRGQGFQGGTYNKTDTYQFAAGGSYDMGALKVSADLARTNSTFTGSTASVDFVLCGGNFNCGYTVDFNIGSPGGSGPEFNIRNFDATNPANYSFRGFYEESQQAKGDDWQARLDFDYDTGLAWLPKVEWGVRYVDRNASALFGSRYSTAGYGTPISGVPLDYELFRPGFRGTDAQPNLRTWLSPTYDSIRNNLVPLRQFILDHGETNPAWTLDAPAPDPNRTFTVSEQSYAGYAQANYVLDVGNVAIDGQIGLRAVQTKQNFKGREFTVTGFGDVDAKNSFTDWLPNASARIHFTRELQLRLSASKTRTRPSFAALNPGIGFDPPPDSCRFRNPIPVGCVRTAHEGNPDLQPLKSNNFDASLEYYFPGQGFVSLAVFRRNLKGFLTPGNFTFPIPDPDTGLPLVIQRTINSDKGHITGFEAQVSTFFDFDGVPAFLKNFGVQANVTRLNGQALYANFGDKNDLINRPLQGLSKWSYNLIGMYEHAGLSLRAAYNWRSSFLIDYSERRDFTTEQPSGIQWPYVLQQQVRPVGRLDLSASYALTKNFTLFGDLTNVLSKPVKVNLIRTEATGARFDPSGPQTVFPFQYRYEERILSVGGRFRF